MSSISGQTEENKRFKKRPKLAFFSERHLAPGSYYYLQWAGVSDQSKTRDVNLISVVGGVLGINPMGIREPSRNRLYNLINGDNVDGIIIAGGVASYITPEEVTEFVSHYSTIPLVAIAETLPEIPSILVENSAGMRELFVHLVRDHGYRRIAFIKGPGNFGDAFVRYQIYREVLAEYGLPYNPDLVAEGDYIHASGGEAVKTLLDERKVQMDVIVAANDNMALGAMWELQKRGIRIPEDIAVAGYDHTDEAKMANPLLTTVYQPIYEQGRQAVDMLLKMIAREKTSQHVMLPTRMVIGQSCGCVSPALLHAAEEPPEATREKGSLPENLSLQRAETVQDMVEAFTTQTKKTGELREKTQALMGRLFDEFIKDLTRAGGNTTEDPGENKNDIKKMGSFLPALSEILYYEGLAVGETVLWHDVISALRRHLLAELKDSDHLKYAEKLWGQARIILSNAIERMEVSRRYKNNQEIANIFAMGESLSTTFDTSRIIDLLAERIGTLNIPSCYLAAFTGRDFEKSMCRLLLAYNENQRLDSPEKQSLYRADQILPPGLWPGKRYHLMLESLHFLDTSLGILLLEVGPGNGNIYENLRSQISNALQGSLLVQQVHERARALETANEEIKTLNDQLTDENLQMRAEMDLARRIQTALLPSGVKSIHKDFEISAVMLPAEQVGGDYYDIALDQEGNLWLGIGDVSGHGVTPGLIMMMAQTVHTSITTNFKASARDIVVMTNKVLYKNVQNRLHEDHFMTFTTLKYLENGKFQFAGAHLDLIIYRRNEQACELIETPGTWLNFIPDISDHIENFEFYLKSGDILFLYTDGITEAKNKNNKILDIKRFSDIIEKHAEKNVDDLRDSIIVDVMDWCSGRQKDDMSLVVVRRI